MNVTDPIRRVSVVSTGQVQIRRGICAGVALLNLAVRQTPHQLTIDRSAARQAPSGAGKIA
jgi:hypothetical protein